MSTFRCSEWGFKGAHRKYKKLDCPILESYFGVALLVSCAMLFVGRDAKSFIPGGHLDPRHPTDTTAPSWLRVNPPERPNMTSDAKSDAAPPRFNRANRPPQLSCNNSEAAQLPQAAILLTSQGVHGRWCRHTLHPHRSLVHRLRRMQVVETV
ncbi:hypothetical protein DE146DRAFT_631609 [Phaeosphaeria sp. MPI-PUGE-AT-0046c]|nr:hypothetical protein DE146DRAFT_631609 [Phaeosphaeria sp. MPI-PUGE-AT-0046c]